MTSDCANSYDKVAKAEAAAHATHADAIKADRAGYRAFNNYAKSALLRHVLSSFNSRNAVAGVGGGLAVLDLASGRGGDLGKVLLPARGQQMPVTKYTALDISPASIEEARRRCVELYKTGKVAADGANVAIEVFDVFSPEAWAQSPHTAAGQQYHVVTMQFALHYGCRSLDTLRAFLALVAGALVEGGVFCGTTSDGHSLRGHLLDALDAAEHKGDGAAAAAAPSPQSLHRPFRISLPEAVTRDAEALKALRAAFTLTKESDVPTIGIAYRFQLDDLVDDVEFSIPRGVLIEEARHVGLEPIPDLCKNLYTGFRHEYVPSGTARPPLTDADVSLCSFYLSFAFRKTAKK